MLRKKLNALFYLLLFMLSSIFQFSCKKLVEINAPPTSINGSNVYTSDETARAVLTGIYANLSSAGIDAPNGLTSISSFAGLSADELTLFNGTTGSILFYYTNSLSSSYSGYEFWNTVYPIIYIANSAIEGLSNSNTLTPVLSQQLLGEAKFIRAFCYFYLVNLYGDVPLVLTSNYQVNASLPRSSKTIVYQQIITDLKDAQDLLSVNYLDGSILKYTSERVRPTKWAATALLARVYLFINDWTNAEIQSSILINNSSLFSLTQLKNTFLKNNLEAIWQLQPVNTGWNTQDAKVFILPPTGPTTSFNSVYLSNNLLKSFEPNDLRKTNWVDSLTVDNNTYYYPYKYKLSTLNSPVSEYAVVLRLGEQYLIRAEARAQLNNIAGSQTDLNTIRSRAGLGNTVAADKLSLLSAILHERQVELFTEWGHRWLDLKRTGNIDAIMTVVTPQKGGTWNTNWQWYPIQALQIQRVPQLIQNLGY